MHTYLKALDQQTFTEYITQLITFLHGLETNFKRDIKEHYEMQYYIPYIELFMNFFNLCNYKDVGLEELEDNPKSKFADIRVFFYMSKELEENIINIVNNIVDKYKHVLAFIFANYPEVIPIFRSLIQNNSSLHMPPNIQYFRE